MLRLALPVLVEQMLGVLVFFSDRLLAVYYFDESHQAAITSMAYLLWLTYGIFSLVGIGATALVARQVGAGAIRSARHSTNQALLLGVGLAAVVTALGIAGADDAVHLMQLKGVAADAGTVYLHYLIPAVPLIMIVVVGNACLRGAGDMVAGLVIMAIVNVVNVAVSWALVLGAGPLPSMGWDGIAIGTMTGHAVGGLLMLGLLVRGRRGLRLGWRWLRPHGDLLRRLLRVGVPGGMDMLSIIGCQLWFVTVINTLGDTAAAAHGVAICIESMAFLPGAAFQVAAMTLAGQYLGAKNYRKAGRSVLMALAVGGGIMMLVGVAIYIGADPAARVVSGGHREVAALAAPLLRTVALAMPALALTMILSGALRGAGDTRWVLGISLIGLLGVRIPLAYWLALDQIVFLPTGHTIPGWDLGVLGAWYAMVVDLSVRAALVLYRFSHGGWKKTEV
ncbi:MAG: MATE family efflux transporter [Candidatus Nealsonbacteria bacterium]|nr:MATE family efflux transporter [Candidatus Nealsonbacteria bacterium]